MYFPPFHVWTPDFDHDHQFTEKIDQQKNTTRWGRWLLINLHVLSLLSLSLGLLCSSPWQQADSHRPEAREHPLRQLRILPHIQRSEGQKQLQAWDPQNTRVLNEQGLEATETALRLPIKIQICGPPTCVPHFFKGTIFTPGSIYWSSGTMCGIGCDSVISIRKYASTSTKRGLHW